MNTTFCLMAAAAVGLTALGGCRSGTQTRTVADSTAAGRPAAALAPDTAGHMAGMPGMQGMNGMGGMSGKMSGAMMDSMVARMRMMEAMSPERMQAMLPMHRQQVANMLAQMNAEMRGMNMASDPDWTALADSMRQDLVRLPELSGPELKRAMPAHTARVMRLMRMHREMIGPKGAPTR